MPSVPYVDGSNLTRQRDLVSGDGSLANPDVTRSEDPTLQGIATTINGGVLDIETLASGISAKLPDSLVAGRLAVDSIYRATTGTTTNLAVAGGVAITASVGAFIATAGFTRFRLQVNNIGASNLTGFEISTRCHPSADMQTHLNIGNHYTSPPANSILRFSGDTLGASISPLTLTASTGKIILAFDFTNFFAETLRVRASAAAATTLEFFWGGA